MAMTRVSILSLLFAISTVFFKSAMVIFVPLYLDSLQGRTQQNASGLVQNGSSPWGDVTNVTRDATHVIDFYWSVVLSWCVDTCIYGLVVLCLTCAGEISAADRAYPKRRLLVPGVLQAVYSLMNMYASSGSRTAPYLQAILGNVFIPITFVVRYVLLRKRPSRRQAVCAAVVLLAEAACLVPAVVPGLESSAARREEGGAEGAGAVLWPIVYIFTMVPLTVAAVMTERNVQAVHVVDLHSSRQQHSETRPLLPQTRSQDDTVVLNIFYVLFWMYLSLTMSLFGLFWLDLIPGIGKASSFQELLQIGVFTIKCHFNAVPECAFPVYFYAWGRNISKTMYLLSSALLMKYGEGASFLAVCLAFQTPIIFLFWTLFDEQPFHWHPHAYLDTWLSIAAVVVMVPAVIIYKKSKVDSTSGTQKESDNDLVINSDEPPHTTQHVRT